MSTLKLIEASTHEKACRSAAKPKQPVSNGAWTQTICIIVFAVTLSTAIYLMACKVVDWTNFWIGIATYTLVLFAVISLLIAHWVDDGDDDDIQ